MPAIFATAPGKIILCGEHAVVYQQPAIALPVTQVQAKTVITPNPRDLPGRILIQAPNINFEAELNALPADNPLAAAVRGTLAELGIERSPALTLRVTSTIPVAAGLGSGAAVSVSIARALSAFLGHPLANEQISRVAFEVERLHHGTPSGIDNTVITYAMPIYYVKGEPINLLTVAEPFTIVIADTGVQSPTRLAVRDVRKAWESNPAQYENIFAQIGQISQEIRQSIENGKIEKIGLLLNENHALLQKIDVSSPELDRLVAAATSAGALGAKLSGGGRGGNMLALATPENAARVADALITSGATRTIINEVAQFNATTIR
jgi:mevalonate kinase